MNANIFYSFGCDALELRALVGAHVTDARNTKYVFSCECFIVIPFSLALLPVAAAVCSMHARRSSLCVESALFSHISGTDRWRSIFLFGKQ